MLGLDEADRLSNHFRAGMEFHLFANMIPMHRNRFGAEIELTGDLLRRLSFSKEAENLELAIAQFFEQGVAFTFSSGAAKELRTRVAKLSLR